MSSDQLSVTFAALADPTRRAILAHLARGEASVTELAKPFEMSLPAISKHLKVLEEAGLAGPAPVVALGVSMAKGGDIIALGKALRAKLEQHAVVRTPQVIFDYLGGEIFDEPVAAPVSKDGRLGVFVRGTQNRLFLKAQTKPNGPFGEWVNLGGYVTSTPLICSFK